MRVLVLAPHTDDGEFGCGGTMARLIREGAEIYYLAFSHCGNKKLIDELIDAVNVIGVHKVNCLNYNVRNFDLDRQNILNYMIGIREEFKPDMVFTPSGNDIHQDHVVIYAETLRAFKHINILAYEMPWNNMTFNTRMFYKLQQSDVSKKIQALQQYKSQAHRNYMNDKFIEGLARVRGVQCGVEFAECFDVIRMVR